jgi:hypothetical protein
MLTSYYSLLGEFLERPEGADDVEMRQWISFHVELGIDHPLLALGINLIDGPGTSRSDSEAIQKGLRDFVRDEFLHVVFVVSKPQSFVAHSPHSVTRSLTV